MSNYSDQEDAKLLANRNAFDEAAAECETPAAQRSVSHRSGGNPESGAPPSNTAPAEYTGMGTRFLRSFDMG